MADISDRPERPSAAPVIYYSALRGRFARCGSRILSYHLPLYTVRKFLPEDLKVIFASCPPSFAAILYSVDVARYAVLIQARKVFSNTLWYEFYKKTRNKIDKCRMRCYG